MKNLFPALMVMLLTACSPCVEPEGEVATHTLMLDELNAIQLNVPASVRISQGPAQSVSITCPAGALGMINQEVRDGMWEIFFDPCVKKADDIVIDITVTKLNHIGIAGSGNVTGNGFFNSDQLNLELTGSGDISGTFNAGEVTTLLSGSGNITISGSANIHKAEITGSGELEAVDFLTHTSEIEVTGSGDAEINVKSKLSGIVTGSGSIYYYGSPASVQTDITGSGEIVKK